MVKVGIIGATGYTGVELVRLLANHPGATLEVLSSHSYVGKKYSEVYPHMLPHLDLQMVDDNPDNFKGIDQVFLALPHGVAGSLVEKLPAEIKVIDLGADFRLANPREYEEWYEQAAPNAKELEQAVYGLPELKREKINGARIVANPGCYPTATILGLAPALASGMLVGDSLIIDAKSGVSGAGRGLALGSHFSEVNENFKAYNVGRHRHTPEIEQELSSVAGRNITVTFSPHLVPMTRGILSTCYGNLASGWNETKVREYYQEFYTKEKFVQLLPQGILPQTKWVQGTNYCLMNVVVDERTGRLIIISVIDNLVKGAAGQAVQNFNLLWGYPEDTGLLMLPQIP
ncbi:MAG TPA: N-acetyl-gamma-glutamyl-phosphate reductase [Candidatus Deferrimicrobium sp.]|nr:N-acetyl-gamma-glutamyl-phosphate reductase [Candidatus Deferrimicrobium sp.]